MDKKIDLIIPVYKAHKTLFKLLCSIAQQEEIDKRIGYITKDNYLNDIKSMKDNASDYASILYNGENNIASEKIKPGETKSGYIYFEGPSVYGESQSVIDLGKVKYLKVTTLSDAKKNSDGSITGHNAEYFLEVQ